MLKSNPQVSIILPTYNGYKYITTSIVSCLSQTYKNIELIIVDDGSSSKTKKIIHSFTDKRVRIITLKKNKGLSYALNKGFSYASGDYLTWTSDDNYYEGNAIERMLDYLIKNDRYFVFCSYYHFKDNQSDHFSIVKPDKRLDFKYGNYLGACFLYSRKVYKKTGKFTKNTPLVEDYDYWIRVKRNFKLKYLDQPLYYFRRHEKSLTARYAKKYDLYIATTLIKIKNRLVNITSATDDLLNSVTLLKLYQSKTFISRIFSLLPQDNYLNKQIQNIAKSIYEKRYFTKIKLLFDQYQNNKLSFAKTILRVKQLLN